MDYTLKHYEIWGILKKKTYVCKGWLPVMNSHNLHPLKTSLLEIVAWAQMLSWNWFGEHSSELHPQIELYLVKKRLPWNKIQKHCSFFWVWKHFRSEAENCPRVFSAHSSKACIHDIHRGALVHMTCVNWTSVRVLLTLYIHIKVWEENMLPSRWCRP